MNVSLNVEDSSERHTASRAGRFPSGSGRFNASEVVKHHVKGRL
jgi:hypothetical protein